MSNEEIAKQLISLRLDHELGLRDDIKDEIVKAFHELCSMGYSGKISPLDFQFSKLGNKDKISDIIDDLVAWLYEEEISVCNEIIEEVSNTYDTPIPFLAEDYINQESYDKTLKERLRLYSNRFKYEAEAWIASGLLLDMPMADVESQFAAFMDKPYNNPIFNKASKIKGARATRLLTNGKSYGVGKYVSSISSLIRLARAIASDTFRRAQFYSFRNMGIIGFYVYRGSSYPCSLCDSMVGYHDFVYADLPPYHNNCVCYVVPVFANSLE